MDPEAQRNALAAAFPDVFTLSRFVTGGWMWKDSRGTWHHSCPILEDDASDDLLNDANALRAALAHLNGDQQMGYVQALRLLVDLHDDLKTVHWFAVVNLPVPLCFEALLRTLNLWKA